MGEHKLKENDEGDEVAELMAQRLDKLPEDSRLPLACGMIHFLGKLVEFWERNKPMTAENAAAFMLFVEQLHIEKADERSAFVMLELLGAARAVLEEMKGKGGN